MNASPLRAPVALLMFNRPRTTRRVLEAIAKARPTKLLVVADGPRPDRSMEAELCAQTRAVVNAVDWPCEVITNYSPVNLGCKQRILSGLDWVFSQVDEAIILEDDCLPDRSFFAYCDELLQRYRDDERIHMIRGGNFLRGWRFGDRSYYFSRLYHIWGWATWARAWQYTDVTMQRWPELRDSGWLESLLPAPAMVAKARHIFDQSYAGTLDTWEYHWVYSSWLRNALAISPFDNLITNIGFGDDATHLRDRHHPHAELPLSTVTFPLRHPVTVEVSHRADLHERKFTNRQQRPSAAIRAPLRRLLAKLRQTDSPQ